MIFNTPTWAELLPLLPEIIIVCGAFLLLLVDLFLSERYRAFTLIGSVFVLLVSMAMIIFGIGGHDVVLSGMFIRDIMSDVLKVVVCLVSVMSVIYAWSSLRDREVYRSEVPVLMLFAVVGMMILISAGSLVTVYLGLELLALCSYAMVAMERDNGIASEAAIKYFILGSLSSGLLLYGMSLLYGAFGTLDLRQLHAATLMYDGGVLLYAGMVFLIAGIAFKFGAVPFHMWLPDTYQGAPTAIVAFIGSVPKLAAFAMLFRLLEMGLGSLDEYWRPLLAGLAVLSLLVGNLFALIQTNLKRMLAYSTISHVGFLFIGFVGGGSQGFAASMFYTIAYAIMSSAAFASIIVLARKGFEADQIDDFKGLNARSPLLAAMVLCIMVSLAGVPPFLGFWAKLAVLRAALQGDALWLAMIGVIFAVIAAFYYLRVIKVMYFDAPEENQPALREDRLLQVVFSANALALLCFGIFWDPIMTWCQRAFGA